MKDLTYINAKAKNTSSNQQLDSTSNLKNFIQRRTSQEQSAKMGKLLNKSNQSTGSQKKVTIVKNQGQFHQDYMLQQQ